MSCILITVCFIFKISAQTNPEPPKKLGVFTEIVEGVGLDEGESFPINLKDVRFNAYFIPPNAPNISAYHIIMKLNDTEEILNFNLNTDGTGAPDGVEVFEEEGIWYIYTESYTGVNEYDFECSVIYTNGTESPSLIFESNEN